MRKEMRAQTRVKLRRTIEGALFGAALATAAAAPGLAQQPVRGGTLAMARPADILSFDPYDTQDDYSIFTELTVYDRLVRLGDDGKSIAPELATSWMIAPDGLTADFKLREGVKFSDGSPLTPEDVIFSLGRSADPKSSWGFLLSPVKSVTKVDDHTVRLTMSEPFAPLLPALSTFAASIYSKANFERYGAEENQHPLGTGAFMLKSWDRGQQVTLVRNPNYWQPGKPYLDGVVFRNVGDDNARIIQLQSGDLQLSSDIPASQVARAESGGAKLYIVSGTATGDISFNEKVKPLDQAAVRCAMGYALDRESIARVVYFGKARAAKSILPSATLYYDPDTNPITYDLAKAKQLLASSSVPNGFTLTATVASGNSQRLSIAQIWAASLAKIGVTLNIEQVEMTTAQQLFISEKHVIRISTWTNDTPDPDEFLGVTFDYKPQNGLHSSYHSDEARDLVLKARAEIDPAKRQKLYSELQRIENRDCPFLYSVEEDRIYAATPALHGFAPNSQGKYDFENVWLVK